MPAVPGLQFGADFLGQCRIGPPDLGGAPDLIAPPDLGAGSGLTPLRSSLRRVWLRLCRAGSGRFWLLVSAALDGLPASVSSRSSPGRIMGIESPFALEPP